MVLGVKSIFVLHHSGVLAYSKKLDFNPVTMLTYTSRKLEFDKNNCRHSSKKISGTFTEEAARADGQVRDVRMNNYVGKRGLYL